MIVYKGIYLRNRYQFQQKAGVGGYTFLNSNISVAYTGIKFDAAAKRQY